MTGHNADEETLAALDFEFDPLDALTTGPCFRCGAPVETEVPDPDRFRELIARVLEMGYGVVQLCPGCRDEE